MCYRDNKPRVLGNTEPQPGYSCLRRLMADLVQILQMELSQYHKLMDLVDSHREALSSYSVPLVSEISKRQETVILRIKVLEEARKAAVHRMAHYLDCPADEVSLATLTKLPGNPYYEALISCQEIMSFLRSVLEILRSANAISIQHRLRDINSSLERFSGTASQDS